MTKATLTQDRFYADRGPGYVSAGTDIEHEWQIPVALRAAGIRRPPFTKYLANMSRRLTYPVALHGIRERRADADISVRNMGDAFGKMSAETETNFSPEERIHFLGDAWAMVRAGRLKVGDYLSAMQNFQGDRNRAVIGEVMGVIPRIHDAIASPADRPAFEAWVRKFLGPIASDLNLRGHRGQSGRR